MCKAFNQYMHEQETQDTLFEGQSWTTWRNPTELVNLIAAYVKAYPRKTRLELWRLIINDHFMRYTASEYKKAVTTALERNLIYSPTPRSTKRLNDSCQFIPE